MRDTHFTCRSLASKSSYVGRDYALKALKGLIVKTLPVEATEFPSFPTHETEFYAK